MRKGDEPAFPSDCLEDDWEKYGGLTKREWFAGMALMGMHARNSYDSGLDTPEKRASICFIDADAMLKESEKEQR